MPSQRVPNFDLSPSAFWMSAWMPAASNACLSSGRSLASQRGEVAASGRITPTLPALSPLPVPEPPLSSPQAVSANVIAARAATTGRNRLRIPYSLHGPNINNTHEGWRRRSSSLGHTPDHNLQVSAVTATTSAGRPPVTIRSRWRNLIATWLAQSSRESLARAGWRRLRRAAHCAAKRHRHPRGVDRREDRAVRAIRRRASGLLDPRLLASDVPTSSISGGRPSSCSNSWRRQCKVDPASALASGLPPLCGTRRQWPARTTRVAHRSQSSNVISPGICRPHHRPSRAPRWSNSSRQVAAAAWGYRQR